MTIHSTPPPWRGTIDGEPVELELAEVRKLARRHDLLIYDTYWSIDHEGIRLASSKIVARERKWPDVVALFKTSPMAEASRKFPLKR